MGDSEELARKERRRRLIERLNEKEKLLGPHSAARGGQRRSWQRRSRSRGHSTLPVEVSRSRVHFLYPHLRLGNRDSANFACTEF
jgi:hypothetical protein